MKTPRLRVDWTKGPDGLWRGKVARYTRLCMFIVKRPDGMFGLQLNNSDFRYIGTFKGCKRDSTRSIHLCLPKADGSVEMQFCKDNTLLYWDDGLLMEETNRDKSLVPSVPNWVDKYAVAEKSKNFPYESWHERSLRKWFQVPEDHPVRYLLDRQRRLYDYHHTLDKPWLLKPKEALNAEEYKGPVQELRLPKKGQQHAGPGFLNKVPKLENAKWKTIRLWAKAIIKEYRPTFFIPFDAILNAVNLLKFPYAKTQKITERLKLIFAADYENTRSRRELEFKASEKRRRDEEQDRLLSQEKKRTVKKFEAWELEREFTPPKEDVPTKKSGRAARLARKKKRKIERWLKERNPSNKTGVR